MKLINQGTISNDPIKKLKLVSKPFRVDVVRTLANAVDITPAKLDLSSLIFDCTKIPC